MEIDATHYRRCVNTTTAMYYCLLVRRSFPQITLAN